VAHAEANAKTVEGAVADAAAQLGLRPDQVEVEVLEEAVTSTFGVIGRPARVRVTPRTAANVGSAEVVDGATAGSVPAMSDFAAAPTDDQAGVSPDGQAAVAVGQTAAEPTGASRPARSTSVPSAPRRREGGDEPSDPESVAADTELAGDFLEGLLDVLDLDGDITTWIDELGGHIDLEGAELDVLVGPNGDTLQALQELTRLAVLRQAQHRARIVIDVNGFRSRRREELVAIAKAAVQRVVETRQQEELVPMNAAERKIVHDAVAEAEGVASESAGEDPNRRVVILPA
jgi:spoIIIJ-associated protein